MKPPFTHAFLLSKLHYNPATGKWKRLNGKKAGNRRSDGYLRIRIAGQRYLAHVLIWFYMTKHWPVRIVDHEDNDRKNDRWNNLRLATRRQNRVNSKCRTDNKSGYKGVRRASKNRWIALLGIKGRTRCLGWFKSPQKAHRAYYRAAKKRFGTYARAA